jgi:hypothetical protein
MNKILFIITLLLLYIAAFGQNSNCDNPPQVQPDNDYHKDSESEWKQILGAPSGLNYKIKMCPYIYSFTPYTYQSGFEVHKSKVYIQNKTGNAIAFDLSFNVGMSHIVNDQKSYEKTDFYLIKFSFSESNPMSKDAESESKYYSFHCFDIKGISINNVKIINDPIVTYDASEKDFGDSVHQSAFTTPAPLGKDGNTLHNMTFDQPPCKTSIEDKIKEISDNVKYQKEKIEKYVSENCYNGINPCFQEMKDAFTWQEEKRSETFAKLREKCKSSGSINECKHCLGIGTGTCPLCHGVIFSSCVYCHGSGFEPKQSGKTCSVCKGSGKEFCRCNNGFEICTWCWGTGYYPYE